MRLLPIRKFQSLGELARARIAIVIAGVLLPYVARIPGTFVHGTRWLEMYLGEGLDRTGWIQVPSALVWGTLFGLSFTLRRTSPLKFPALACFGLLGFLHAVIDVSGYGGLALVYVPIYGVPLVLVTFLISIAVSRRSPPAN